MILHLLSRSTYALVVVSLLLGGLAAPARSQERQVSAQVRKQLFKQVLADYADVRECVDKEEGGARAAEENTSVEEVDLNRDGVPEYEVGLSSPCVCGMVNCSIYVYRKSPGGYELILDGASGLGIELLKTSSNGYLDLRVGARDTAATQFETTYKFDGKQYRESSTTIVHQETGESKPAYRRLQFKRGASSATVQGKVSIALPDNYLVGARAGQVMTVQLTSAHKSVIFMVMTPTSGNLVADNARTWTGKLPETGDYQILVEADDRNRPYSMTVSIK